MHDHIQKSKKPEEGIAVIYDELQELTTQSDVIHWIFDVCMMDI